MKDFSEYNNKMPQIKNIYINLHFIFKRAFFALQIKLHFVVTRNVEAEAEAGSGSGGRGPFSVGAETEAEARKF